MPSRKVVAKELGALLKVMSHPDRILLVHALSSRAPYSVSQLAKLVGITSTRVSQHLALLRAFRVVEERSEGRRRIYRLALVNMPDWLLEGIDFVAARIGEVNSDATEEARQLWLEQQQLEPTESESASD
ncbi:MAG: metalloregulator ArsR/SmtB family transcription factor [Pseudomonadota bacterium]|mgnify:FL=1